MPTYIPNETGNQIVIFGTEAIPGMAATPTAQLLGTFESSKNRPIRRREERTGGYDRYTSPSRERATFSGNYAEDASYESLPALMQYAVKGNVAGVSDGNTPAGYTYTFTPTFNTDDIETMTVQYGVDGMGFQATGVRFDEWTVSADHTSADNVWAFSGSLFLPDKVRLPGWEDGVATGGTTSTIVMTGAGWTVNEHAGKYVTLGRHTGQVRRILSNTADTLTLEAPVLSGAVGSGDLFHIAGEFPVITIPEYETIEAEGTKIFLDRYNASASALGTTDVSERVVSWNVGQTLGLTPKYRAPGQVARVGRGPRWVTFTLRLEADRWDEYREWEDDDLISLRIEKEGSVIDTSPETHKLARFDIEKAIWDVLTEDTDQNNMTRSLTGVALLVPGDPVFQFVAKNALATLP